MFRLRFQDGIWPRPRELETQPADRRRCSDRSPNESIRGIRSCPSAVPASLSSGQHLSGGHISVPKLPSPGILNRLDRSATTRTFRPLPWPGLSPLPCPPLVSPRSVAPGRQSAARVHELSQRTVVSVPAIAVVAAQSVARRRSRSHITALRSRRKVASFAHLRVEGDDGARFGHIRAT